MPPKKKPAKPVSNEEAIATRADRTHGNGAAPEGKPLYPTPLQIRVLEKLIGAGNHFITACKATGISWDTFQGWRDRGARGDPNLREFVDAIDRGEAACEQRAIDIVMECAGAVTLRTIRRGIPKGKRLDEEDGQEPVEEETVSDNADRWRPAAWMLEHRFGERFSRMRKLQHSGILTHRQVVILHEDDPSLTLEVWPEDGDGPAQIEDATYHELPQDTEAGADGEE